MRKTQRPYRNNKRRVIHEDKVIEYLDRLDALNAAVKRAEEPKTPPEESRAPLEPKIPSVTAVDPSQGLSRRLDHVEYRLRSVSASLASLMPGPELDVCLVQYLEEEVSNLKAELRAITNDILYMPEDETGLADRAASVEKGLGDQRLAIKRLLHEQASSLKVEKISVPEKGSVKPYKLNAPMFDGNILNWSTFWEQFSVTID